ncbi:hypothetical protein Y032_0018g3641 [Ancylostoma ceylanicum]|uniref:Uncharacterized protein n=1 Tax=Ancylostoma ceylanicum TaxID=53326 RepID=A0A016V4Q0_9BILA|nr:hypothetical protein Y032_0018g3641 [Ancylostoma ceylanicum]
MQLTRCFLREYIKSQPVHIAVTLAIRSQTRLAGGEQSHIRWQSFSSTKNRRRQEKPEMPRILDYSEGDDAEYYDNVSVMTAELAFPSSDYQGLHLFSNNTTAEDVVKYFSNPSYESRSDLKPAILDFHKKSSNSE